MNCLTAKIVDHLNAKLVNCLTSKLVKCLTAKLMICLTAKLVNHLTSKLVVVNLVKLHLTKFVVFLPIQIGYSSRSLWHVQELQH